ncbi:MAG TPA: WecB/TagA/CpsF family glycosyltransferase [Actinomycetota bacterium]|nr:WecB/TagA/CpsF family glycosyltransferase [Actinomycetota bacterium]
MTENVPTIELLGVRLARLSADEALTEVERLYELEAPARVFHANAHTLNLASADQGYRDVLNRANLVLNDGKGVMLGARLKGSRFPVDLNGNFFTPLVLERSAARGWPVYFLGAKPGVAERAAALLEERFEGLKIAGVQDGFFAGREAEVIDEIQTSGTGLLLVGLGNPKQETWLDTNLESTGARLGIGVGAFFDFISQEIRRAPAWMNRIGLEWLFRLALEPRRMWRRYIVGNPAFIRRVLKERRS